MIASFFVADNNTKTLELMRRDASSRLPISSEKVSSIPFN